MVPEDGGDDIQGGGTKFRGVVLVEVLRKAISGITNRRLSSSIRYHGIMYGFCAGRVMRTATLELNLLQQLISMRKTVLHSIFLDLSKVYYALDIE